MKTISLRRTSLLTLLAAGLMTSAACGPDDTSGGVTANSTPVPMVDMGVDTGSSTEDMGEDEDEGNNDPVDMPDEEMDDGGDMGAGEDMGVDAGDPDLGDQDMMDMEAPPVECDTHSDCSMPEVCIFDAQSGDSFCGEPTGGGDTGDLCRGGDACASNVCVNGACANPCDTAADCPSGFVCEVESIPLEGGADVSIGVCLKAPEPCLADTDCTTPEVCVAMNTGGSNVDLTCEDPLPGGGDLGDACTIGTGCLSGLCEAGVCTKPCQRPDDCSTDGSLICAPSDVVTSGGDAVNVCKPRPATQCLSNSGCAGSEQCVASRGANQIDFTCDAPNAGGGEVGATCNGDGDCAQNLCLGSVCAPPCQSNGDCTLAADFTCELQPVTLTGGGMASVQVCTPPVVCDSLDECKITEACYARRTGGGLDTICRAPNAGGGALGQVCDNDSECASNLCLDSRFGKVCSLPCDDPMQCNVAGYTCTSAEVATGSGATTTEQVCAPSTPSACSSDDDCASGTSCAIIETAAGGALESVCVPSTGRLATGVACAQDTDCESRVCLAGSCAAPCEDSNQCGPRQLCLTNPVTKAGVTQNFDVCERLTDQPCSSTDSCTDGVRVCGELRNTGSAIEAFCAFPVANGSQLGEDCTSNLDCREGICLSTIDECSVVCDEDADCSLANNQICSTFLFPQSSQLDLCVRGCTDNASCNSGDVCTINDDVPNNDIDQICSSSVGPGLLGDVCTTGADCDTGLCLTTVLYNGVSCTTDAACDATAGETCRCPIDDPACTTGKQCATSSDRCSRICNDDGDCGGGAAGNLLTTCSTDVNVTLPDGIGTKEVALCGQDI